MIRAGVPESVAMEIAGHQLHLMFGRHNIIAEKDLRDTMRKTQEYLNVTPSERKIVALAWSAGSDGSCAARHNADTIRTVAPKTGNRG